MALIPIDWADMPGDANPVARVTDQMKIFSDWYTMVSEGRLRPEWRVASGWVRVPGSAKDYAIPESLYFDSSKAPQAMSSLASAAIRSADPSFDFSGVDVVIFVLPSGQTVLDISAQGFQWQTENQFSTSEGMVNRFAAAGRLFGDGPGDRYWSYWAHEVGHMLGMPHLGDMRTPNPIAPFEIMDTQGANSRTVTAWLRYVNGWMTDAQVYCQILDQLTPTTIMLKPMNEASPGVKAAMVRLSPTQLLIVESRRPSSFDRVAGSGCSDGVLVYRYDATLGHLQDFLLGISPPGRDTYPPPCASQDSDGLLNVGQRVSFGGVTVKYDQGGQFDTITLARG